MLAASNSNHADLPQTPRSLSKSHDDGDVKYFFQRPEQDLANNIRQANKWSGDDSLIDQNKNKMWGEDRFSSEWTNDLNCGDHSVSQPIPMQRRPGSFPSGGANDPTSGGLLSPKSAENLGLKLVNLILEDNSPAVKELETRVKTLKLNYNHDDNTKPSTSPNDSKVNGVVLDQTSTDNNNQQSSNSNQSNNTKSTTNNSNTNNSNTTNNKPINQQAQKQQKSPISNSNNSNNINNSNNNINHQNDNNANNNINEHNRAHRAV